MTPDPREREILLGALGLPGGEARARYLGEACKGDADLRRRVEALLAETQVIPPGSPSPEARAPGAGPSGTAVMAEVRERAGDRIGGYRLLQQIGEGGCGVVFMAEQEVPVRRRVALKVIKLGMDTRSVIARFEAERQALAMMDHPNIARVLDAGATETGRPYFVMELVRGVRITDYCDDHQLPTSERLDLFLSVCHAVQHAHQKGIIHRDLKPSNILVTLHDSRPVPKVIDFGIAKATQQRLTDKTLFTEFAAFVGTPAYMSPEQAEMSGLDIDTRSDIYSLGVLLYELLTGETPFDAEALVRDGLDACRRTLREEEPLRPSTRVHQMDLATRTSTASRRRTEAPRLVHQLRGDLDWIVMKCLEKDRTRRYETASELAADLERYLRNEPVVARPPSQLYRLGKFLRRNRLMVGAVSAVATALVVGAGISVWQAVRARAAEEVARQALSLEGDLRRAAEHEKAAARLNEYIADMNLAQQSLAAGNLGRALQLVEKHVPKGDEADLRGFEWRHLWQLCRGTEHASLSQQEGTVLSVAVSPDGRHVALGLRERISIVDLITRTELAALPRGAQSVAFLPSGAQLVSGGPSVVRVWSSRDWSELKAMEDESGPVALSPDGRTLATQSRGGVRIRETAAWGTIGFLRGARGPMAFSPDGERLVTDTPAGLTVWRVASGEVARVLADSTNAVARGGPYLGQDRGVAWSSDGGLIVAPRNTLSQRGVFVLSAWDPDDGREMAVVPSDPGHSEHLSRIAAVAFAPGSRILATASWDHSIRLWDMDAGRRLRALQGHVAEVWSLAFAVDGQSLVSGAKDGAVHVWPVRAPAGDDLLPTGWQPLGFSADSQRLAAMNGDGQLAVFSLASREPVKRVQVVEPRSGQPSGAPPSGGGAGMGGGRGLGGPFRSPIWGGGRGSYGRSSGVVVRSDLQGFAQALPDGTLALWNLETEERVVIRVAERRIDLLAMSPDGRVVLTGTRDQGLSWWEFEEGTNEVRRLEGRQVVFAPDSRALAVFRGTNTVEIWDVAARTRRTTLELDSPVGTAGAFSSDGRLFVTTSGIDDVDNAIQLWSAGSGEPLGTFEGHKQPVMAMAFAPDDRTLASAGADGVTKFWNVTTRQELLSIRTPGTAVSDLLFSPDGRMLLASQGMGPSGGGVRLYRAPSLEEIDGRGSRSRRNPTPSR